MQTFTTSEQNHLLEHGKNLVYQATNKECISKSEPSILDRRFKESERCDAVYTVTIWGIKNMCSYYVLKFLLDSGL